MSKRQMHAILLALVGILIGSGLLALETGGGREAWAAEKAAPALSAASSEEFSRLHALIRPQEGDSKYLDEIAWAPTLWDARKKAAAEGKPLFIFATGCGTLGVC